MFSMSEKKVASKSGHASNTHCTNTNGADCPLVRWTAVSLINAQATALVEVRSDPIRTDQCALAARRYIQHAAILLSKARADGQLFVAGIAH